MNCPRCGSPTEAGAVYCPNCGFNLSGDSHKAKQPADAIPRAYKPISPWGYIGWNVLFAIPIIGFILLIVFSFHNGNINRRNYARSYWCALLILILLFIAAFVTAAVTGSLDELIAMFEQYAQSIPKM